MCPDRAPIIIIAIIVMIRRILVIWLPNTANNSDNNTDNNSDNRNDSNNDSTKQ